MYHLHNIIPLIFGNKQTIEFRLHTSTFEDFKIFNFLLLNTAILKFVLNNEKKILENKINFEQFHLFDILRNSFGDNSKLYEDTIYYFDYRRRKIRDEYCIKNNFFFDEDSLKINNPFRRYEKNKYSIRGQKTNFLNDFSNFLTLQRRNQGLGSFDANFSKKPKYTHVIDKSTGAVKIIDSYTGFEVKQSLYSTDSDKLKVSKTRDGGLSSIEREKQRINNEMNRGIQPPPLFSKKPVRTSQRTKLNTFKFKESSDSFQSSQKDDLSEVVDKLISKYQGTGAIKYVDPVNMGNGIVEQIEENNMDF